ncbi:MAG TPA: nuclear transport factor 2 family protein [Chitinophagaceae bacterium]|jgi:ketosteroid isomerase-like protein|nr:nuclear transport factor 2 family protein [Chitinophagaceae bacterium]
MTKSLLVTVGLLYCSLTFSQTGNFQKEINEQVWKPFIKAFNNDDNEAFKAVHSKEVARVIQDDNRILAYDEYFRKVPDSEKAKWANWKKNIELRFIQRIASADKAFEVGYYKSTSTNATTGEKRTGYGKFHVLLRKENGVWKILMDADANEKTDEAIFLSGKSMEQ